MMQPTHLAAIHKESSTQAPHLLQLSSKEIKIGRKAHLRRQLTALALVAPLLIFILFAFAAPIASMLYRSVYSPQVAGLIPETVAALSVWDKQSAPTDAMLNTMALVLYDLSD